MSIAEIIIEVRKKRVKFKHICLNEDMYDALTVNGHKVLASLERQFDCYIYKSVSKATTLTKVDLKYINFRGDTLGATQHQLNKPASYEDILNAL